MGPIFIALAAIVLIGCSGDSADKNNDNDAGDAGDNGDGGVSNRDGTGGTGMPGSAGTGGVSGSAGTGGMVDEDAGVEDGGADASTFIDGSASDAAAHEEVDYIFGFRYGTTQVNRFYGNATLLFSDSTMNNCELAGGTFDLYTAEGDPQTGFSVDLSGNPDVDFCASETVLPLAGGLFDGVNWLLKNFSDPLSSRDQWQIDGCESAVDGGEGLEACEGSLNVAP